MFDMHAVNLKNHKTEKRGITVVRPLGMHNTV